MFLTALIGIFLAVMPQAKSPTAPASAMPSGPATAQDYITQGEALLTEGRSADAHPILEKALRLCRASADVHCSAVAENDSGVALLRLGDVEEASRRLEQAAADFRTASDLINEGKVQSNLGWLLYQSGDFEHALAAYDRARLILHSRDRAGYAKVLNNLGLCYQSLAEYEKAREYFVSALAAFALAKRSRDSELAIIKTRLNLGRNYMLVGQLQRAQRLHQRDLIDLARLGDTHTKADVLRNLGQTLWRERNVQRARQSFEEALALDRSHGDRRGESSALHYLALVAETDGNLPAARMLLSQAIQIRRDVGLRDDAADSLYALARLEYRAGNLAPARKYAEQALALLELVRSQVPSPSLRAAFYSRKRQFFDLLVDIEMAPGTPESDAEGLIAAERGRGRALTDMLAAASLLQPEPPELVARRASIQNQLDYLSKRLSTTAPSKEAGLRAKVEELVAQDEEIQARIHESVAEPLGKPLSSVDELQRVLPRGWALLEYSLGVQHSYAWLVDQEKVRAFSIAPESVINAKARRVVRAFGRILERQRSPAKQAAFKQSLKDLSSTLFAGIAVHPLPKRLVLVPDGVLHRVPFAALQVPGEHAALGLEHDLVRIPSAAYLTIGRQSRPVADFPKSVLAVVDPVFSATDPRLAGNAARLSRRNPGVALARLPFTSEIQVIQELVPRSRRTILRGFDASRDMLGKVGIGDFAVLHFSTHALIDDQVPELSRVALSMLDRNGHSVEGFIRPFELAQLHLNGSIIVLSACDTALGKQVSGEGLMGLTSSLLYAGGSQLVLTLTDVDAEAASYFLGRVYRRFFKDLSTMEDAMRQTRRSMARSRQFSDPYYWAAFTVVGRPAITVGAASSYNGR